MKRSGLQIAGGVVEIVAGAFWLITCLFINKLGSYFGLRLETLQIVMPVIFILFGAFACTGKRKKSDVTTYGILNIAFIALQFYFGTYVGLGIVQMVLLFIAAFLFFFSKKTQAEIVYEKRLKDYIASEPKKNKKSRLILIIVGCVIGVALSAIVAFCL